MSDDGADLGIDAETAMKAALGNEEANADATLRSPDELLTYMREHASLDDYGGVANVMALAVLRLFEQRPEALAWPAEPEGDFYWTEDRPELDGVAGERFSSEWGRTHRDVSMPFESLQFRRVDDTGDLYEAVKAVATDDELVAFEGCSGFQWGWAVNAARNVAGLPPVANPAIVTLGE